MTPVGGPFGGTELGPRGLGREGEGLVVRHSRRLHGNAFWGRRKEKKELLELLRANWRNLMQPGRRSAGLRWTPVEARDRAGPTTLDSHGGGATRRLGVTGT
jgi:hypothetical protein